MPSYKIIIGNKLNRSKRQEFVNAPSVVDLEKDVVKNLKENEFLLDFSRIENIPTKALNRKI